MYTEVKTPFSVNHKKRMYLFSLFETLFNQNEIYHIYFSGIVNFHLLKGISPENLPSFEEVQNLKNGNLNLHSVRNDKKWCAFLVLASLNKFIVENDNLLQNKEINVSHNFLLIFKKSNVILKKINLRFPHSFKQFPESKPKLETS